MEHASSAVSVTTVRAGSVDGLVAVPTHILIRNDIVGKFSTTERCIDSGTWADMMVRRDDLYEASLIWHGKGKVAYHVVPLGRKL